MDASPKAYDLDLTQLNDEVLVVLSQECGYSPARIELVMRHLEPMNTLIAYLSQQRRLKPEDRQDAFQEGMFGLLEAIAGYDTLELGRVHGCPFRVFLRLVLLGHFSHFVRRLQRYEKHVDRSLSATAVLNGKPEDGRSRCCLALSRRVDDPAAVIEWTESLKLLEQEVEQLDAQSHRVWDLLSAGLSLLELAAELKLSYYAAKRLRQKVLAHLATQLREPTELEEATGQSRGIA